MVPAQCPNSFSSLLNDDFHLLNCDDEIVTGGNILPRIRSGKFAVGPSKAGKLNAAVQTRRRDYYFGAFLNGQLPSVPPLVAAFAESLPFASESSAFHLAAFL